MSPLSNFAEIRPIGAALLRVESWTDGHDETNERVLRLKIKHCSWGRDEQGMWAIQLGGVSRVTDSLW